MADKEEKSADVPEELDRTRGGIKSLGREATKTEIRVDTGSHPAEKSGSPFSFLKNFLKKKPSPAKKEGGPPLASKPPLFFASANSRFAGIWLPASDMGSLTRIGFLVSRLVVAIAGVWLVYLLTVSFLRAFEESRTFPFVFAVTLGAALFLSIVSIPMRWSPAWFVGFPLLALLGLLGGQVFFYPTTDPSFFTFLGKAPAYIFNHVWIGVLAFELALILFVTPRARGLKGFFFVLAAYGLAGFIFNRLEGLALEAAWLGTGVFRGLPTIYLQPVFVAPTLFIPLFFIFSLGAFFLPSNFRTGRSTGWLGLNIPVLLFSAVLGWGVMQKNGVPTLLDFFLEERRGIGLTQTDVDGALLELKTTNFDVFRDKDTVERYRMELKKTGEHSRTSDESHYTLSVVNPDGFPVFFLDKSDFELSLDEKKITKWNLKTAPPEEEKPPLYLLSAILPPVMHDETAVKETSKTTTAPPSDTAVETPMEEGGSSQGLAHGLEFVRPTLGEYLPVETTVEVAVGESALFQTVTLYLGSEKLHEWGSAPYTFTWNTADLPSGKYVLKVKGATFEGVQASDSVPVFMGQARLKVIPPEGTATGKEGVFNYQDVVFVVDLSSSQWDSWGGKAKWEIQKALFESSSVIQKLSGSKAGMVVFGGDKSWFAEDCSDASFLAEPGEFSGKKISELLGKKRPKGVSALFFGLKLAFEKKPQKIVVIADGADSCQPSLPAKLKDEIAGAKGTIIDILTLGPVGEGEAKVLGELALAGRGNFVQAVTRKELEEKIAQALTRTFEVLLGEKVLLSAPVDGKARDIRPGKYQLKLAMTPPFADRPILLKNGLTTEIKLKVSGDKTEAVETYYPF